ncbi:glycerophosphodiester phosphodiesterase [Halomarina oriensis]|uniref:Glycerophosphodiester phosphodiesterase n=1 Tax=Halomarina oriensis TaxID=671145 RepID=A0A6B0GHD4_9EURY|nr:glycerophosphodiester phosphodiesterase [Halomarina oriensis]MWG34266.1 glycerophosphodiester phosphodiesterase [Halomarina oriensis]
MQEGRRTAVTQSVTGAATGGVDVIAHRGFADRYPENTVGALERATAAGGATRPTTVELDVMPSAEGHPVVFHDATLDRLTDPPATLAGQSVWETPLATLRDLEVLGSGEPIPLLDEAFAAVPSDVRVNVELKHPGVDPGPTGPLAAEEADRERGRWRPAVDRVLAVADDHGHDLLCSSFFEGALAAVRERDPTVPLANVFHDSIADGFAVADRYDCEAVHAPWNMIYGTSLFNEPYVSGPFEPVDLVGRAHDDGRAVNVWTVETTEQASELHAAGVDGIMVDDPAVATDVRPRPDSHEADN